MAYECKWGIVGSGWISSEFVKDLVLDPAGRGVTDVKHKVAAVGSRSVDKAQKFIDDFAPGSGALALGSYDELVQCAEVDIVYIGTPHMLHYDCAKLALNAGKPVLVEKPATLNAAEWRELTALAKAKGLFLMEGMWTRFFPLAYRFQQMLHEEKLIGEIRHVYADLSMQFLDVVPESHRAFNPKLAGGAMLDLGVYPLLWSFLSLLHHPDNEGAPPTRITGSMMPHPRTGVDMSSSLVLDFDAIGARANLTCSLTAASPNDVCVRVIGTEGSLIIPFHTSRPGSIVLRKHTTGPPLPADFETTTYEFPIQGFGLHWEADAVARCLRDGELESKRMSQTETALEMTILDEWRKQSGYKYPAGLEKA